MRKSKNEAPIHLGDEILTPIEAADFCKVSRWAMYKRVKRGHVMTHKVGKRLYFLKSEIISNMMELQ